MISLTNTIKALVICILVTGAYTLFRSTRHYQLQLASEGQDIGIIEAMMHYSTLAEVWSRMLPGWLPVLAVFFIACLLLLSWLKAPLK